MVILLGAAVIAVPIFRRIGLGSALGYLAAGLAIGPFGLGQLGLGYFEDPQAIIQVAELGVVLFLFVIGLEMQPSRLWAMRGEIFGLGFVQVGLAIFALAWVGVVLGYPLAASFVAGTGFVLTSTAIVMQMLEERGEMGQPKGRRIIAILLFEDLAIVPILAIVAFIAPGVHNSTTGEWLRGIGIGLASIAVLVLAGRYLLNPMFRLLARFGAREVMTAAALLVALGAAVLLQAGGLSMAMGAFLAGVLLSESCFRHQLEADIEPFRGLLLGLFFVGVGMALDLNIISANWKVIALSVPAFMVLKMLVIYFVAKLFKADRAEAVERAVLMAQGGEFAFVLYAAAVQFGILEPAWNATLTAIIIISMVLTPLLIILHGRLHPVISPNTDGVDEVTASGSLRGNVLLIGFGRVGQIVSQPLIARGHSISAIDNDTEMIRAAAQFGFKVWYGDGCRMDILHAAGAASADLVVIATDKAETTTKIAEVMKHEYPLVPVLARAFDRGHAIELMSKGVDYQIRETFESAIAMGREAVLRLGADAEEADELIEGVLARDRERLALQSVEGIFAGRDLLLGNKDQPAAAH